MKKRRIALLTIFVMFFLNAATVFAADENSETLKKITIGVCGQEGFAESNSDGSLTGYAIDYLAQLGSDAGYNIDVLLIDKGLRPEEVIPSECDLILTCGDLSSYSGYSISKAAVFEENNVLYVEEDADEDEEDNEELMEGEQHEY